jgi:hypothetical protein
MVIRHADGSITVGLLKTETKKPEEQKCSPAEPVKSEPEHNSEKAQAAPRRGRPKKS